MPLFCHRCHAELPLGHPADRGAQTGSYGGLEPESMLFCPHCSAPQIRLPEHMRPVTEGRDATATTGSVPPPHPQQIDWPAALRSGAIVAGIAAVLAVGGLMSSFISMLGTFWIMGCAVIAIGLYRRQRPAAWMNGRTGLRIGTVTGLLVLAAVGLSMAVSGVVARFGLHRMAGFDLEMMQGVSSMQAQMAAKLAEQGQGMEVQRHLVGFLGSPEVRGGSALLYLGVCGLLILLFAAGGGAFAGLLRAAGRGLRTGR